MPKLVPMDIFRSVFVCMRGNECACVPGWTLCEYKLCRRKIPGDAGLVGWALSCIIGWWSDKAKPSHLWMSKLLVFCIDYVCWLRLVKVLKFTLFLKCHCRNSAEGLHKDFRLLWYFKDFEKPDVDTSLR